jgi:hypothetical protein
LRCWHSQAAHVASIGAILGIGNELLLPGRLPAAVKYKGIERESSFGQGKRSSNDQKELKAHTERALFFGKPKGACLIRRAALTCSRPK